MPRRSLLACLALLVLPAAARAATVDDTGQRATDAQWPAMVESAHGFRTKLLLFWPKPNGHVKKTETLFGLKPVNYEDVSAKDPERGSSPARTEAFGVGYGPVKTGTSTYDVIETRPGRCPDDLGGFTKGAARTVHLRRTVKRGERKVSKPYTARATLYTNASGHSNCAATLSLGGTHILVKVLEAAPGKPACGLALKIAARLHRIRYVKG